MRPLARLAALSVALHLWTSVARAECPEDPDCQPAAEGTTAVPGADGNALDPTRRPVNIPKKNTASGPKDGAVDSVIDRGAAAIRGGIVSGLQNMNAQKTKDSGVTVVGKQRDLIPRPTQEDATVRPDLTVTGYHADLTKLLADLGLPRTIPPTLEEATADPAFTAAVAAVSKNPVASESYFQRRLARNPNDSAALTGMLLAQKTQGNTKVALESARRLQALEPENKVAAAAVKQLENQERASSTVDRFKKFADGFKPDAQDAGDLQAAQRAMGAGAGRTAGASKTPAAPPDPTAGLTDGAPGRGRTAAAGGTWTPSVRGLAAERYQFAPLVLKAMSKKGMGDFTGALLDLTQELDADPRDLPAWIVRAEVDNALTNFPAGVHDAGKALELAPQNARALRARAYAEIGTGDFAAAYADAAKAVELDASNGLGFLYLAMAEEKTGHAADAIRHLRQAVALDPALEPMTRPLAKTLGVADAAPVGGSARRSLLRGGMIALSSALLLFGLLGTKAGRELTRSLTTRGRAAALADEDGDAPAGDLTPGTVLGGTYRIERELGRGGMGVVYAGHDLTLDRPVAIKRLIQDASTTPDDLARFLREARLVAALKHPNLAHIYTVLPGKDPFLVFELVDGKPLDQVLREDRVLPLPAARRIVREVAAALGAAHAAHIIHRDLKPGNVMIAPDGGAKVMDFGIAHRASAAATRMTRTIASGTPPYMPPEQAMGSVSKASDLYALGVMAYELLTGVRPFDGPDFLEQKIGKRFEPATRRNPALPPGLDDFFARALEPDPTKRPADAAAFADALDRACDATPRASAGAA